jgi:hypothetical protein
MFVIPFYTKPILPSLINWSLQPIALFLENRGKQICETDDPVAWLSENGFFLKRSWKESGYFFAEIDSEKTRLQDFYSFEQVTREQQKGTEECWRTFFLLLPGLNETETSIHQWNDCIDDLFLEPLKLIQSRSKA